MPRGPLRCTMSRHHRSLFTDNGGMPGEHVRRARPPGSVLGPNITVLTLLAVKRCSPDSTGSGGSAVATLAAHHNGRVGDPQNGASLNWAPPAVGLFG